MFDIVRILLYGGIVLVGIIFIVYTYLKCSMKEITIKGGIFYNKEIQCNYRYVLPYFDPFSKIVKETKESYEKRLYSIMGIYYDNPNWLVDTSKARSAIGFLVDPETPQTDKDKLAAGLTSVNVPSFKAMALTIPDFALQILYGLYVSILESAYFKKYCKTLVDTEVISIVTGDVMIGKQLIIFIPTPSEIKNFNFINLKTPEMNDKWRKHVAEHTKPGTSEQPTKDMKRE